MAAADGVGVAAEDLRAAGGGAELLLDAEEDGDVLVGVEAIGDEEGDDDDIGGPGLRLPMGDERLFLHEHAADFGVEAEGMDAGDLFLYGEAGVFIEGGAVADGDERGAGGNRRRERPGERDGAGVRSWQGDCRRVLSSACARSGRAEAGARRWVMAPARPISRGMIFWVK